MNDALKKLREYRGSDAETMLLIERVGEEIERVELEVAKLIAERDGAARTPRRRKYCPGCKAQLSTKAPLICPQCSEPLVAAPPKPVPEPAPEPAEWEDNWPRWKLDSLELVIRERARAAAPEPAAHGPSPLQPAVAELERLRAFRDAILGSITENAGAQTAYAYIYQHRWDEIKAAVEA